MLELNSKDVIMAHGEWLGEKGRDFVERTFG